MSAQVIVHLAADPGLEGGLEVTYREELKQRGGDRVALLVPTNAAAGAVRRQVLSGGSGTDALLDPRIMTFQHLAESVLVANHSTHRQMSALQQQLLVAGLLAELKDHPDLKHLQPTYDKPGTAAAMCAVLEEIKHAGISSADFRGLVDQHCPDNEANAPVAAVFATYQKRLQQLELYDAPGLFWHAVELLQGGKRQPLEDLELLLLDGFQQFTATQMGMIAAVASFVQHIEIRLWRDKDRPQMTPHVEATLHQIKAALPKAEMREDDSAPEAEDSNLGYLRQHVFASEAPEAGAVDQTVQVLEAAGGVVGECREVARRIKLLLTGSDDLQANQVAVLLRSWDSGHADALRQALAWYGIPAEFGRGPALSSVPAVQAALDVLDVVSGGWRREDVLKLLNGNYVRKLPQNGVQIWSRQFEKLTLEAGIVGGSTDGEPWQAWADGFDRLFKRLQDERMNREALERAIGVSEGDEQVHDVQEDDEGNRFRPLAAINATIGIVDQCRQVVDGLRDLLRPLSKPETLASAAVAFDNILGKLDIVDAAGSAGAELAADDLQGLAQLSELLREIAEAPDMLGEIAAGPGSEFPGLVRRACSAISLQTPTRRRSGVQVPDLTEAGLEPFEVVFICGMRDGLFPRRGRTDAFYPDSDRAALQAHIPGIRPRAGDIHDDKHLLHAALSAARRQVWLTYPISEADGSPSLRSLYVDEVLRHWETGDRPQLPKGLVHTRRQSKVIEDLDRACHYLEVLEALQVQGAQLTDAQNMISRPADLPTLAGVQQLSAIGRQRADAPTEGVFAGMLSDSSIIAELGERYGPEHVFSASQLNSYAACPMQFFFNRVLGLEGLQEPAEDADIRDLGLLAHRVLAYFYRQRTIGTDHAAPLTADALQQAYDDLDDAFRVVCDGWAQTVFGAESVWQAAIARMKQDLRALLEYEADQNAAGFDTRKTWTPPRRVRAVEARYGRKGSFAIDTDEKVESVKVQGSIDRVDLTDEYDGSRWWVLWDYKSGDGVAKKLVQAGADVQLPLYAMAVEEMYPGEAAGFLLWGYWRVRRPVGWSSCLYRGYGNRESSILEDTIAVARRKIGQYVADIRSGRFAAAPNEAVNACRYCDFADICGNRQGRRRQS